MQEYIKVNIHVNIFIFRPKVVALTTLYGNVNQSQAIINSARILDLCERSDVTRYIFITKKTRTHNIKNYCVNRFFLNNLDWPQGY